MQMLLSKRFLQVIADHLILPQWRQDALSRIDPNSIYVENIRSVLGSSKWVAELICEAAYKQGLLDKKIQLLCPDGGVAKTLPFGSALPPTVPCWGDNNGVESEVDEPTSKLDRITVYALKRKSA